MSRHLRLRFSDDPSMRLCHESIYQAFYHPNSRFLRPSRLAPHRRSPLRTGCDHRRAHQCQQRRRPRFQQPMLTIHDRPFLPVGRSEAGHWEGDLIIGDNHLSAIGTLVERQTQMLRLVHLHPADSDSLHDALVARMQHLPPALMLSITWDQGTEMARHLATADRLGAPVYFCGSRSPWQRGSNENTNGLLRDYFRKGVTLANYSLGHLMAVEKELNNRPRMVLQDRCPADLFASPIASLSPSVLRRRLEPTPDLTDLVINIGGGLPRKGVSPTEAISYQDGHNGEGVVRWVVGLHFPDRDSVGTRLVGRWAGWVLRTSFLMARRSPELAVCWHQLG